MSILDVIQSRRTVKKFKADSIERGHIQSGWKQRHTHLIIE